MKWFSVFTNNGWRIFPDSIREAYLKKTSTGRSVPGVATEVFIDMPGMILTTRTVQNLSLNGLEVSIPSQDFKIFFDILTSAKEEILPDNQSCFKLRGWMHGIILTPELRKDLLVKMAEILPAVELIGKQEDEQFTEGLDKLRKEAAIVPGPTQREDRMKKNPKSDKKAN